MVEHHIEVRRTARYYVLGDPKQNISAIWFLLHGYAQLASDFLSSLTALQAKNTLLIAPEGLSKFYWKDFSRKPGACWMTREDREAEIEDYLYYLNTLYQEWTHRFSGSVRALGFSQGATTLSRWANMGTCSFDHLFFYAGDIAHEIDLLNPQNAIHRSNIHFLYGIHDPFITNDRRERLDFLQKELNNPFSLFTFSGKHEIHLDALNYIKNIV